MRLFKSCQKPEGEGALYLRGGGQPAHPPVSAGAGKMPPPKRPNSPRLCPQFFYPAIVIHSPTYFRALNKSLGGGGACAM